MQKPTEKPEKAVISDDELTELLGTLDKNDPFCDEMKSYMAFFRTLSKIQTPLMNSRRSVDERLAVARPLVAAGTHRMTDVSSPCDWNGDLENSIIEVWRDENGEPIISDFKLQRIPKQERPQCGARCRTGNPCQARVVVNVDGSFRKRCRMHGGLSTGPTSEAGRARIVESNRRRAKHRVLDGDRDVA